MIGVTFSSYKGSHTRSSRPVKSACAGRPDQVDRTPVVPPHAPFGLTGWPDGASTRSDRFRKKKLFILYRIGMEVMPMDSLCFSDENHTKFHVNRTIINEISFRLWEWIFHEISFIFVRIMSLLVSLSSAKHKESIGLVFAKIWWEMRKSTIFLTFFWSRVPRSLPRYHMAGKPLVSTTLNTLCPSIFSCREPRVSV